MNIWQYLDNHSILAFFGLVAVSLVALFLGGMAVNGVTIVLTAWANRNKPTCACCEVGDEPQEGEEETS